MASIKMLELSRRIAIGLWLVFIVIRTGTNGLMAIWDAIIFGAFMLLITLFTRSVRLRTLLSMFALGGFAMGVEAFLSNIILPNPNLGYPFIRALIVPILENGAFILPAAVVLWKRRDFLYSLGASDVMLMMGATASGFLLMEEAFVRLNNEWSPGPFFFLPSITETGNRMVGDYLCASHSIWGAMAGISVGLALFARAKHKAFFWPIIAVGVGLGLFDHFTNNYGPFIRSQDAIRVLTTTIMLHGWLTIIVFFIGLIAAVGIDLWMNFKNLPKQMKLRGPLNPSQHALAYEHFYAQNMTGDDKWRAELCAGIRLAFMLSEKPPAAQSPAAQSPAAQSPAVGADLPVRPQDTPQTPVEALTDSTPEP